MGISLTIEAERGDARRTRKTSMSHYKFGGVVIANLIVGAWAEAFNQQATAFLSTISAIALAAFALWSRYRNTSRTEGAKDELDADLTARIKAHRQEYSKLYKELVAASAERDLLMKEVAKLSEKLEEIKAVASHERCPFAKDGEARCSGEDGPIPPE